MTKAFDKSMAGLEDAHAYLNGEHAGFTVDQIEASDRGAVAIRSKTGLSQPVFDGSTGISRGTLKNSR